MACKSDISRFLIRVGFFYRVDDTIGAVDAKYARRFRNAECRSILGCCWTLSDIRESI